MSEEWGPWIKHDLSPCPVVGQYGIAQGSCSCGMTEETVFKDTPEWSGSLVMFCDKCGDVGRLHIVRYRIRKPRALTELRQLVESLTEPTSSPSEHCPEPTSLATAAPVSTPGRPFLCGVR